MQRSRLNRVVLAAVLLVAGAAQAQNQDLKPQHLRDLPVKEGGSARIKVVVTDAAKQPVNVTSVTWRVMPSDQPRSVIYTGSSTPNAATIYLDLTPLATQVVDNDLPRERHIVEAIANTAAGPLILGPVTFDVANLKSIKVDLDTGLPVFDDPE